MGKYTSLFTDTVTCNTFASRPQLERNKASNDGKTKPKKSQKDAFAKAQSQQKLSAWLTLSQLGAVYVSGSTAEHRADWENKKVKSQIFLRSDVPHFSVYFPSSQAVRCVQAKELMTLLPVWQFLFESQSVCWGPDK